MGRQSIETLLAQMYNNEVEIRKQGCRWGEGCFFFERAKETKIDRALGISFFFFYKDIQVPGRIEKGIKRGTGEETIGTRYQEINAYRNIDMTRGWCLGYLRPDMWDRYMLPVILGWGRIAKKVTALWFVLFSFGPAFSNLARKSDVSLCSKVFLCRLLSRGFVRERGFRERFLTARVRTFRK